MNIALCIMVKNEEATLPRLLKSVEGFADTIIALDTGSTDDTLYQLSNAGATYICEPFIDFGRSRTRLMKFARGKADWLLLLDADQTLEFGDHGPAAVRALIEPPGLESDEDPPAQIGAYQIQHAGSLSYWIPRLVRGDREWQFHGATHEYLADAGGPKLLGLRVQHHFDGGSRADKFERDERLLRQEMLEEPDNARTVFYLANTLRDLGRWEEVRELYLKRVAMGGWAEEVFCARLEAARTGNHPLELWECWASRPTRAEPLLALANYYAEDPALAAAVHALRLKIPLSDDILFVEKNAYLRASS